MDGYARNVISTIEDDLAKFRKTRSEEPTADPGSTRPPPGADPTTTAPTATKMTRYGIDAADFLKMDDGDEDPWIIKGLLPEGMPTVIAGPPKSKKSWIELYLAVCVAAGVRAFDLPTRRTRVLIIAREDTARETRRRIRLIMCGLGIEPENLRGWLRVDATNPLYLDCQEHVEILADTIAEFLPAVVFIDSLSRVHSCDENSRSEMAIVMNVWSDLCSRFSCSVVLLHHVIKWDNGGSLIQRIRGTGDIGAVLRVAIGVERVADAVSRIETDGNLADLVKKFEVRFEDRFEGGTRSALVIVADTPPLPTVARSCDPLGEPLIADIADFLFKGGTKSVADIRRGRGSKDDVARALATMRAHGLTEQVTVGRKNMGLRLTLAGRQFTETGDTRVPSSNVARSDHGGS